MNWKRRPVPPWAPQTRETEERLDADLESSAREVSVEVAKWRCGVIEGKTEQM